MDQTVWQFFITSREHVPPMVSTLIIGWTQLFRPVLTTLYALVITIFLVFRRIPGALFPALSLATSGLLCEIIKAVVQRPRPPVAEQLLTESSTSFPSGHTTAVCSLAMIATVMCVRWRRIILILAWTNAIGIALSRLFVGVHWCSDVLAGAVLGVATTWILWLLWKKLHFPFKVAKKHR